MEKVVKKPFIEIVMNNKDVSHILNKYVLSVRYTDYLKGQADELEITLKNPDNLFNGDWYPTKGDKVSAKIGYAGDDKILNCGTLTIDEPEFSGGSEGETAIIKGLAASIKQSTREKCSKQYINKTLIQIAQEIGEKHSFTVQGEEGFLKIAYVAQFDETDLAFLYRISEQYGYIFKITDDVLTFTKLDILEKSESLLTLTRKDLASYTFTDTSTKTYKACRVQYYNPKTGKYQSVTVKGSKTDTKGDTLKIREKFQTKEQAEARAKAGLKNGQKTVTGTISLKKGNPYCISGANFNLAGFALFDGKYKITQATHEVTSDNYTTNMEIEKIAA